MTGYLPRAILHLKGIVWTLEQLSAMRQLHWAEHATHKRWN